MYFSIKNYNSYENDFLENRIKIIKLIAETPEIEKIDFSSHFTYYNLSIKNLRKLKLLSLDNENIKIKLYELYRFINDEKLIHKYGENPLFLTTSGVTFRTSGSNGKKPISSNNCVKNRFVGNINKKFDFHKVSNKRFK